MPRQSRSSVHFSTFSSIIFLAQAVVWNVLALGANPVSGRCSAAFGDFLTSSTQTDWSPDLIENISILLSRPEIDRLAAAKLMKSILSEKKRISPDGKKFGPFEVEKSILDPTSGSMNRGVYFVRKNGSSRVFKIILPVREGWTSDGPVSMLGHLTEHDLNAFLVEIRNALLCEKHGGPKLYGLGSIQRGLDELFYMEMENLSSKNSFTLKGCRNDCRKRLEQVGPQQNLSRQAARVLVRTAKDGIIPHDPDFIVNDSGLVRWIDSGAWAVAKNDEELIRNIHGPFWTTFNYFYESKNPTAATRKMARSFIDEFLSELKTSPFDADTQRRILEKVFENNGRLGGVLTELELMNSDATATPIEIIKNYINNRSL